MTAEVQAGVIADLTGLPGWTLDEGQLGDLELLLCGAFAPLEGFMRAADVASVAEQGTLADGTPWPVPITLDVPERAVPPGIERLLLHEPEGTPLAVMDITERIPAVPTQDGPGLHGGRHARPGGDGMVRLAGPVTGYREPEHGPFRHLRRLPGQLREELAGGPVLACVTRAPLNGRQIGQLRHAAGQLRARLLLLPLVAGPAEVVVRPEVLVRAVRAATRHLPSGTVVVPVPLASHGASGDRELGLRALVAAAYGASHLFSDSPAEGGPSPRAGELATRPGLALPVVFPGEWAYDRAAEVWRPLSLIDPGTEREDLASGELEDMLDGGEEVPAWFTPPAVAAELVRARPPRSKRGLVVFMTGLSGSGKSTIARALGEALSERGDRTVSLLDGDLVRRLLSAGLTFSRADRDLNIARISFVAAEVARHGGIAICAPIAPYAAARAQARAVAQEVGDFVLIHVATPTEVCEARDRKGLYAKARAGLIDHFTGISDPYEEPTDADLVIDTSTMTRQESLDAVLALLTSGGWLPAGTAGIEPGALS